VLTAAAASATARPRENGLPPQCAGVFQRLKTLSDPDRKLVRLQPRQTTIEALASAPAPNPVPTRRRTQFQRQAWKVVAQITQFRLLPDGSIELALYDHGAYMRAGIPSPKCLSSTSRARRATLGVRARFTSKCGLAKQNWQDLGAVVYVTGVGFWSPDRPKQQAAPNGAELQPVIGLSLIAGCR
jgi:hypothetical protein